MLQIASRTVSCSRFSRHAFRTGTAVKPLDVRFAFEVAEAVAGAGARQQKARAGGSQRREPNAALTLWGCGTSHGLKAFAGSNQI